MLNDEDLERAVSKLADFRQDSPLLNILDQYASLIESYKQLKIDYEKERATSAEYSRTAQGHGGKPFVLVLVNGDDYDFPEHLVTEWENGGVAAAEMLKTAVMDSPRWKNFNNCELMVRVYVDMQTWAEVLHDVLDPKNQSISVSAFASGFNRSNDLFDIVDTGDLEKKDDKLRAALNIYADDPQCKHIFFAGCFDARYVPDLAKHLDKTEKFTLMTSPESRPGKDLLELGMIFEAYDTLFEAPKLVSGTRDGDFADWTLWTSPEYHTYWWSREEEPNEGRFWYDFDRRGLSTVEDEQSRSLPRLTGRLKTPRFSTVSEKARIKSNTSAKLRNVRKENGVVSVAKKDPGMIAEKSQKPCRFWKRYGECKFGLDCKYLH
ncbi:hypothetical protein V8C26DRAFT_409076 [Trichoderma gracile]